MKKLFDIFCDLFFVPELKDSLYIIILPISIVLIFIIGFLKYLVTQLKTIFAGIIILPFVVFFSSLSFYMTIKTRHWHKLNMKRINEQNYTKKSV